MVTLSKILIGCGIGAVDQISSHQNWKFEHPKQSAGEEDANKPIHAGYSIRQVRFGKNSLFSREFLYSIVLTNVLSLLLGAGIGAWLQKRGLFLTRVSIE
ncbi:AGAP001411-PA-like protein [Anopheles sinensis]|uniref:AGAP001411-PA-like protein n=1 Tax=Anopheles sinensis TaxID=74873 RepID=A0A084WQS8_ANOSI|nr:AGAP001411-PA-like protein [Anopheles sinensis]